MCTQRSTFLHGDLYNEEVKVLFLNSITEESYKNYRHVLGKIKELEEELGKDFAHFSFEEIGEALRHLEAATRQSLLSQKTVLVNYVDFCIKVGFLTTGINFVKRHKGKALDKFINKAEAIGRIISRIDLYDMVFEMRNALDGVIFALLFEGAKGYNLSELLNLKKQDVSFESNKMILKNTTREGKEEKRILDNISPKCMTIIQEAIEQEIYFSGEVSNGKKEREYKIEDSEYVLRMRKFKREGQTYDRPTTVTINRNIARVSKRRGYPDLNPTSIWYSGMIDYAKKMKEEKGISRLETEHYEEINERFGYDKIYSYITKNRIERFI